MLQNCYNPIVLDRYIYKLQQEDFIMCINYNCSDLWNMICKYLGLGC